MVKKISRSQQWFDNFEIALAHEAEQAGLLEHSTVVGSAREFLIKRVLKSILPSLIHIGTGKILDFKGNTSRQMDIILFDPRFPKFEIENGIGMYPLEGVIAIIEVKSTLTVTSLREALENTSSLLQLTPGLEDQSPFGVRIKKLMKTGYSKKDAMQKASFEFIPASYVYAFNTRLRKKGLSSQIDSWFNRKGNPVIANDLCAVLPRVIAAGRSLGLLHDGYFKINPGDELIKSWVKEHGARPDHFMSFWDTNRCFGWFMVHVLHTACSRISMLHGVSGVQYGIDHYLDIDEYFNNDLKGKLGYHNMW